MADVEVRPYGETSRPPNDTGTPVSANTVTAGEFTLDLIDLGARVASLSMPDRHGAVGPVCLSLQSLDAWEDIARTVYLGDTVGRYANRIAGARFQLDATAYELAANDGANHLHGGPGGFGRRVWTGTAFSSRDAAGVEFTYTSPHLEEGYPGEVTATCRATLSDDGTLTFEYAATTDRPTIISLTNHTYWNLAGTGTIGDHRITLDADRYLPIDATSIPLPNAPSPVAGTVFDLRTERRLGDVIGELCAGGDGGIDHCYLPDPEAAPDRAQVVVRHPATGRTMTLWTDQPGLQVYTGQHLSGRSFCRTPGSASRRNNSPTRPTADFPSPVLQPGSTYRHQTVMRFGVEP